ncbi:hypothetical protein MUG78_16955 [Gordonia alkaliphila]|uniref:hypothetical protein n=1 Tax=Gordonia alkaliphila TaxID=1053547 RepID=UPI001FF30252|nr:hypothetical protein [Gordonia alkaliphila]MCK0441091.1 hypothetical protein [Gordonia alkaliphila]
MRIVGYTWRAENYRPEALIEALIADGTLAPGARSLTPEEALDQAAGVAGIDRYDERTFDSGDFPKVIHAGQITDDDSDWYQP